jgi:hypothetical protein
MTVESINNLISQLQQSFDNYQTFLKSLITGNLINDFLVDEEKDKFVCYYQMGKEEDSFYYTTVLKQ